MADNFAFDPTGASVGASDDVGGVHYPRVKAVWGPDGTVNDTDVATGKPMPVQVRSATGLIPIGEPTDAKSTATDGTSASGISIWKQISASIQLFVFGAGTAAAAQRTTLASDDPAVAALGATTGAKVVTDANGTIQQYLRGIVTQSLNAVAGKYEAVAASATNQTLGATGGAADYLEAVLIVPATTSPGAVAIKDGSNGAITIFTGGSSSTSDLAPIYVPLAMISTSGAWQVTTGINVSAIGIGNFT